MNDDSELLRRFADEGSQEAFAELVRRTVNFVYAAALRQTSGDAHLAQDVTQAVYLALACQAEKLKRHPVLTGWLHTTTRFLAIRTVRTQARWQRREQEANSMKSLLHETEPAWESLRPVIDEALHELSETDRAALLMRFFEGRSLAEVGASIGLNENSARMRVERALEKLRARLARRGVTSTVAALGLVLTNQPVVAAPPGFAATITGPALAGAATGGCGLLPAAGVMTTVKIALGTAGLVAAFGTGAYLVGHQRGAAEEADRQVASRVAPMVANRIATAVVANPAETERTGGGNGGAAAPPTTNPRLAAAVGAAAQHRAQLEAGFVAVAAAPRGINAALRLPADVETRELADGSVPLVDPDGRLHPAFTGRFSLTPVEQATLQNAVSRARDELATLERANATVTASENSRVVIEVKPFAEQGARTRQALTDSLATTLGDARKADFAAHGAVPVETALGQFCASTRTVFFAFDPSAPDTRRYTVTERRRLPNGAESSSGNSFSTRQAALDWAGTVGQLVPADFGK